MHYPVTPYQKQEIILAEWFSKKWHTPTIGGHVGSRIGREGTVYKGRCYQGDGIAYIDVSAFIVGTLTAKVLWKKTGSTIDANSLNYFQIHALVSSGDFANLVNPPIDLTTEVDNAQKRITLANTTKYYGLCIYDDGVLVEYLSGEDSDGNKLIGLINGNRCDVTNIHSQFHSEDSSVPFSVRNYLGFSIENAIDTEEIRNDVGLVNILNVDGNGTQGADYLGRVKRQNFNVSNNNFSSVFWIINAIDSNGDVYNVDGSLNIGNVENSRTAGMYDDNDGNGYYYVTYGKDIDPFVFRNIRPAIDAAKFTLRFESSQDGYITIINQERRNDWNEYIDNAWNNDPEAQNYLDFAVLTSSGVTFVTFESLIDWYNYLQSQNRASEIDNFLTPWGVTFQEVWDFAVAENSGSTDFGNETSFDLFSFYIRIDFVAGSQSIETDNLLTSFTNNKKCCAYFLNKTIGSVDYISINLNELGRLKVYLDDFKIEGTATVPASLSRRFSLPIPGRLDNLGAVSLPISLAESYCLVGDGVWGLELAREPTVITVNSEDVSSEITTIDNGDGTVTVVFPNNMKVYNLVIDGVHFPVSNPTQNDFLDVIEGTSSQGNVTVRILNPTFMPTSIWQKTNNDYHYNAYNGVAGSYRGIKETRAFPIACETKLKFPDCPAVRAVGLNPDTAYSAADLVAAANASNYLHCQIENGMLSKLLLYRQLEAHGLARINAYIKN